MERSVELPFGTLPMPAWMGIATTDVFMHGWDLAKATGQSTDHRSRTRRAAARRRQGVHPARVPRRGHEVAVRCRADRARRCERRRPARGVPRPRPSSAAASARPVRGPADDASTAPCAAYASARSAIRSFRTGSSPSARTTRSWPGRRRIGHPVDAIDRCAVREMEVRDRIERRVRRRRSSGSARTTQAARAGSPRRRSHSASPRRASTARRFGRQQLALALAERAAVAELAFEPCAEARESATG